MGALHFLRGEGRALRRVGELLKVPSEQAADRVEKLLDERKAAEKEIAQLKRAALSGGGGGGDAAEVREVGGVKVLVRTVDGVGGKDLRVLVDDLRPSAGGADGERIRSSGAAGDRCALVRAAAARAPSALRLGVGSNAHAA